MAKVTYQPPQGESDETTQFGYQFAGGKAVDVTDEKHLAKFRGNPHFHVAGGNEHTLKDHEQQQASAEASATGVGNPMEGLSEAEAAQAQGIPTHQAPESGPDKRLTSGERESRAKK